MKQLISFTIKAEFGMFKKPDINDKIFVSYNIIHKPYILGMMGAIMGYGGYAQNIDTSKMPQYYDIFKDIQMAISPINESGIFKKEFIVFNNTTNGTTSNITEQTLINPSYRIYLELDSQKERELVLRLKNREAVYLPYMGKNEFSLWWEDFKTHKKFEKVDFKEKFQVETIIKKPKKFVVKNSGYKERTTNYFYLFERLPIDFDMELKQYKYHDFLYTNAVFKNSKGLENLYECDEGVICLF
jgi:CRISPR-associated protein Cas5h